MMPVRSLAFSLSLTLLLACPVSPSGVDAQSAGDAASNPDHASPDAGTDDQGQTPNDAALPDSAQADSQQTGTCGLVFDPEPLEFTAQRLGERVDLLINVINDSDNDVAVTAVSIGENTVANEFAIASDNPFHSGLIPAGDIGNSRGVKISYTPRDALTDTGFLRVVTTCPETPIFLAELNGDFANVPSIIVTDSADVDSPAVSGVDFDQVGQGFFVEQQIFIKNVSAGSALTVEGVVLDPSTGTNFSVQTDRSLAYTLSAWEGFCAGSYDCDSGRQEVCVGGACQSAAGNYIDQVVVTVRFAPISLTEQWANLRVHSDDPSTALLTIPIHGIGVPPESCPDRLHAPGVWNEITEECVYTCSIGWVDQNGDLNAVNNSDGCESNCTINNAALPDQPDLGSIDANCDGMDGDPSEGFFVDLYASSGGDGSKAHPFNSLQAGLDAANASLTMKKVFLADESFTLNSSLQIPNGVSLFGGYVVYGQPETERWKTRSGLTVFNGPNPAVIAENVSSASRLQKISINGGPGSADNKHAVALKAINSGGLILEGVTLSSGHGFSGSNGAAGSAGTAGAAGGPGLAACNESTCNFWDDLAGCQGCKEGGLAGETPACATNGGGGQGGQGGFISYLDGTTQSLVTLHDGAITASGQYLDSAQQPFARDDDHDSFVDDISGYIVKISGASNHANNGRFTITEQVSGGRVKLGNAVGLVNESNLSFELIQQFGSLDGDANQARVAGGDGADRMGSNLYAMCYGADGGAGTAGLYGNPGAGGQAQLPNIIGYDLVSGDGQNGSAGLPDATGGSGGGGGAGGDCGDYVNNGCNSAPLCGVSGWGGGGGGGGSAGCAGGAGAGGTGGGSSVAILAIDSALSVIACTLNTGDGGNGGAGGAGGVGGAGGNGGAGSNNTATTGKGGAGGAGGHGAYGGGGAGGAGGDSVGIVYAGQAPVQSGVSSFNLGTVGNGGAGGQGAPQGYCQHNDSSACGDGRDGADGRRENILAL